MTAGQHKAGYHRPRTGKKRRIRLPLRIDKLPQEIRDLIQKLRAEGKTWREIGKATGLPRTTLQRWYDLRVEQPRREIEIEALALAYSRGIQPRQKGGG
jgi:DNA invertase Pin-like site-specific DNA recombinase